MSDSVWGRLPPNELNVLPSEFLDLLEPLLNYTEDDIPLKDDRYKKGVIFSYVYPHNLYKKEFRSKLFGLFNKRELKELLLNLEWEWRNEAKALERLEALNWGDNFESRTITNFIGVPEFILKLYETKSEEIPDEVIPWYLKIKSLEEKIYSKKRIKESFSGKIPFKFLKVFQSKIYSDFKKIMDKRLARCILNMPTGTGKTRTSMEYVCTFLNENPELSVVWIADKKELIDQAATEFSHVWEYMGKHIVRNLRAYGGRKIDYDSNDSVFLSTTFGTLKNANHQKLPVGLIVVDEAHMSVAPDYKKSIKKLISSMYQTKLLGLTATPIRSDNDAGDLTKFYDNNIIQLQHTKEFDSIIDYLEKNEILAYPFFHSIGHEYHFELTDSQMRKIHDEGSDFAPSFMKEISRNYSRNKAIVNSLENILTENPDKQILFFGASVEHSKMIATWLKMKNYPAFHIDGKTEKTVRQKSIDAFKKGTLQILCNYGVLTTGFDAPKVDCIFISRPTTSPVLYLQMIGRGLRGPKIGGTALCDIYDIDDNIANFESTRRQTFENYMRAWGKDVS